METISVDILLVADHATIRVAMEAINRGGVGVAVLTKGDTRKFAGLVTDGDIRRALLAGHGLESAVTKVSRPRPITARAGMLREEIAALFSEKIRAVPLLDDNDNVTDIAILERRVRIPVAEPLLGQQELNYVTECILTGWVSSAGKFITRFEESFAQFVGAKHAIATSNGTTALHLALLALDVGPGDQVIVPSLTFIATANAVTYTGATPVIVDSDLETWNLSPAATERAITVHTKAIIPVHLYGHPADMDALSALANRHHIGLIEDAAEAHGAMYNGRRVGSIGDLGVFSFYGNKILTTGEGGMITTDRDDLADKMRILRDHGMSKERRYWHPVLGYNYRMTNMQAALGAAQVERIDDILAKREELAARYARGLNGIDGIILPPRASWAVPVCWLYSVLIDAKRFGLDRDQLMRELQRRGVDCRPLFIPVHKQPLYEEGLSLPNAEFLAATGLSLPSSGNLRDRDVDFVVKAIREAANQASAYTSAV